MHLGQYFFGVLLLSSVAHASFDPFTMVPSVIPNSAPSWLYSYSETIRLDLYSAYHAVDGRMFSNPTSSSPNVQQYSIDEVHTMPRKVDCLDLRLEPSQQETAKSEGFDLTETIALWTKVFKHIESVQMIKIRTMPFALLELILNEFNCDKRNLVAKLHFDSYDGAYTRWICDLGLSFPNLKAMYFQKTDVTGLSFKNCDGKGISYWSDKFSKEKAIHIHWADGGIRAFANTKAI